MPTTDFEPPQRNPLLVQPANVGLTATPETRRIQALRLAPFALLWTVAVPLVLLVPGTGARVAWVAGAGLLGGLTGIGIWLVPMPVTEGWRRILPVVSMCVAANLLRHGSGGTAGYGSILVLLPVIWQGVYGSRRDTAAAVGVASASLLLPVVLFDGYPVRTELPRLVLLSLMAVVVGAVLQSLARSLHATDEILLRLGAVARKLYASDDPRADLCRAVAGLTGATTAVLVERRDGALALTRSFGIDVAPREVSLEPSGLSGRAQALATGEIVFEPSPEADLLLPVPADGSRLHVPIGPHDAPSAVVTATWPTTTHVPTDIVLGALRLVGTDAGLALERTDLVAQLDHQAHRDGLTGLPNRRSWDEMLHREMARAERTGRPLALAVLDLDHFKSYNDRLGHLAGDQLLRAASLAWKSQLRTHDVLARWGGEEFAVLFPDSTATEASAVLQRLQLVTPDDQSFSAGVCQYVHGERAESLMEAADTLMYRAKAQGRDQILRRDLRSPDATAAHPPAAPADPTDPVDLVEAMDLTDRVEPAADPPASATEPPAADRDLG